MAREIRAVDVDSEIHMQIRFENGATGRIEARRSSWGRARAFDIGGSKGSLCFDWEHSNDLLYYSSSDNRDKLGFSKIKIGPIHLNGEAFWPIPGINITYSETTILQAIELVKAI